MTWLAIALSVLNRKYREALADAAHDVQREITYCAITGTPFDPERLQAIVERITEVLYGTYGD
jgi:hypothetical protein